LNHKKYFFVMIYFGNKWGVLVVGTVTRFKSRIPVPWTYHSKILSWVFFRTFLAVIMLVSAHLINRKPLTIGQWLAGKSLNDHDHVTRDKIRSLQSSTDLSGICRHLFQKRTMNTNFRYVSLKLYIIVWSFFRLFMLLWFLVQSWVSDTCPTWYWFSIYTDLV